MRRKVKGRSQKGSSDTQSAERTGGFKLTLSTMDSLESHLPPRWARHFVARQYGRYMGLAILCPVCGASPPAELKYSNRKWRWLAVHEIDCKE